MLQSSSTESMHRILCPKVMTEVPKVSCRMSQVITHNSDLLLTIAIVPPTGLYIKETNI
jgi:hypothetical protein